MTSKFNDSISDSFILKVKERYQNINNYINNMHQSNQNKNFLAHNKNGFDNINNSETYRL